MKNFYISTKNSRSGISKYSNDFYRLVLKQRDYFFLDSKESLTNILTSVSSKDHVHIEIGIFQTREIEILITMINAGYKNIAVTLHDPPLLKYPFKEFNNSLLNKASKFYDIYISRFRNSGRYISKIKCIYVLTRKGLLEVKSKYKVDNVKYLPHIIDEKEIVKNELKNKNLIYFGFIGKNKGIEYALLLHKKLLQTSPGINFYVIGEAIGVEKRYHDILKKTYTENVYYLDYVSEEKLAETFARSSFSLLPFKDYQFYSPFSGSLLSAMKYGTIPFTSKANAVPEIIGEKQNGFYLTGKIEEDIFRISEVINNETMAKKISQNIYNYLLANHTAENVGKYLSI